ncbi:MAG: hypothetical protein CMH78_02960 [Nitrospinae bacterium]|jgi:O-antigen ligase|nr:hypothetical protein [Nitrospinota bacterium]
MNAKSIIRISNYFFALSMPISHSVAYIACGIGFFPALRFWKKLRSEPIILWVTIFIVYGLIHSFFSTKPVVGYNTMFNYFSHWLLPFILGYSLSERKNIHFAFWLYYWLLLCLIFFSILAYFGLFWKNIGNNYLVNEGLLKGFRHHITLAALSINLAFLSFAIGFFNKDMNTKKRSFFILMGLFLVGAVGLTTSRGYYIASSIGLFIFLIWLIVYHKKYLFGGVVFIFLILISAGVYFASPKARLRLESAINLSDINVTERIKLYRIAVMEIEDKPIFGFGPGQSVYQKQYFDKIDTGNTFTEDGNPKYSHLHSFYLNLAAEFGLTGFLIFVIIFSLLFVKLLSIYKTELCLSKAVGVGLLFGFFSVMVGECFDTQFRGPQVAMDLFWMVGIMSGDSANKKVALPAFN